MNQSTPQIRAIIADDHDIVRAGIRRILEQQPGVKVVAEAANGRQAVEVCREHAPDVALLDIAMPELNGLEATRQIVGLFPHIKVLILSMHSSKQLVSEVLRAGASGYLLKNNATSELPAALAAIQADNVFLSPAVAAVVVEAYRRHVPGTGQVAQTVLTMREREVLQLLAEGRTSREIAAALNLSTKTVDAHRATIMEKLGIHTVAELTKFAIREGLTSLDS